MNAQLKPTHPSIEFSVCEVFENLIVLDFEDDCISVNGKEITNTFERGATEYEIEYKYHMPIIEGLCHTSDGQVFVLTPEQVESINDQVEEIAMMQVESGERSAWS